MKKFINSSDVQKLLNIATLRLDENGTTKKSLVPATVHKTTAVAIDDDRNTIDSPQIVEIDKSALESLLIRVAELESDIKLGTDKQKVQKHTVPSKDDVLKSLSPERLKQPVD